MEKKFKCKEMVIIMPSAPLRYTGNTSIYKNKYYTNSNMNANCKPTNCNFPKDTFFKMFHKITKILYRKNDFSLMYHGVRHLINVLKMSES